MTQTEYRIALENMVLLSENFDIEIKVVPKNDRPDVINRGEIINMHLSKLMEHRENILEQIRNYRFQPVHEEAIKWNSDQIEKLIGI